MEFLRKATIVMVTLFGTILLNAQTAEQMQKSFRASYASELKGNYSGALADLQKTYKADSYEYNLRMGWLNYCLKKYPASMEYYQKAIDLKKFSVEARLGYVAPANSGKRYDKA